MARTYDFTISNLGECKIPSPISYSKVMGDDIANYVEDSELIFYDISASP